MSPENHCDWDDKCDREPEAGAFCWWHAEEYERVMRERNQEWWR